MPSCRTESSWNIFSKPCFSTAFKIRYVKIIWHTNQVCLLELLEIVGVAYICIRNCSSKSSISSTCSSNCSQWNFSNFLGRKQIFVKSGGSIVLTVKESPKLLPPMLLLEKTYNLTYNLEFWSFYKPREQISEAFWKQLWWRLYTYVQTFIVLHKCAPNNNESQKNKRNEKCFLWVLWNSWDICQEKVHNEVSDHSHKNIFSRLP